MQLAHTHYRHSTLSYPCTILSDEGQWVRYDEDGKETPVVDLTTIIDQRHDSV